ncbi:MAG: neuromedin U [Planctomycetota bacterium]|jgi:hypothetical protein
MKGEGFLRFVSASVVPLIIIVPTAPVVLAQEEGPTTNQELAKKTQNPVADLISVPFQNNINFRTGPKGKTQNILNIQPVYPVSLNEEWNLITRTIVPLISQPPFFPGQKREFGLGDIQFTGFLSPKKPSKWIWGVGPVFQFPSATDDVLGTEKWAAGPSVVALRMQGPWVYGALINQLWSFAGDGDRPHVNQMLLQPFLNYNMPGGWYLTSAPIITANWQADGDNRWTLPIGGGIGKITRLGKLPVNVLVAGYHNIETPRTGADWQLRIQLQLLFPKKKQEALQE